MLMAAIGISAVVSVAVASHEMRRGLTTGRQIDWEMFLFGLAFLLLETRSVTVMNLAEAGELPPIGWNLLGLLRVDYWNFYR